MDDTTNLSLRSLVTADGALRVSLVREPLEPPANEEVIVRMEACPIHPSDLRTLFQSADRNTMGVAGEGEDAILTAALSAEQRIFSQGRVGQSLPVGNEGAGVVVAAGDSAGALIGRKVAIFGGGMFAQYRRIPASECLVLPDGMSPETGAGSFVNPMTALGIVGTAQAEGHKAIVHTAAASNLGQMLVRLCAARDVPLVNIVRSPEQVALLRAAGARHVCDSSDPSFVEQLTDGLFETGATIAFDAIGGGELASTILRCMEDAIGRSANGFSGYGSMVHKQVYIYGGLDTGATTIRRTYGMAWGIGGWLLHGFLARSGTAGVQALREQVLVGLTGIFASSYAGTLSLADMLMLARIDDYAPRSTGRKFLLKPHD